MIFLKIVVDADACPVKREIIQVAQEFFLPVMLFLDTSHILEYEEPNITVVTVEKGRDCADFVMANHTEKEDIAVTGDYGLAAMLLAKKAYVVHPNGFLFHDNNIDCLLMKRHLAQKQRRQGHYCGHIKKRTAQDQIHFFQFFRQFVSEKQKNTHL